MSEPLVTALCLTRNRREWLPQAICCFKQQNYKNRELVIVADGEDVTDLVPEEERIRLVVADVDQPGVKLTIGAKRNIGCSLAMGEIVATFDDDDYSASGRITDQVQRLLSSGKAVTGYNSMKFTTGENWWHYQNIPKNKTVRFTDGAKWYRYRISGVPFALGTSLCYLKSWWEKHPFDENLPCGEDSAFTAPAAAEKQLISTPDCNMMYATIHPGNTSQRVIVGGCWQELPGFKWKE